MSNTKIIITQLVLVFILCAIIAGVTCLSMWMAWSGGWYSIVAAIFCYYVGAVTGWMGKKRD
jgi:hypothetical protein